MKRENHTNNKNIHKIRNHCHYEGKYRDAIHSICNLRYNIPIYVYIYIYETYIHIYIYITEKSKCINYARFMAS